MSETMLERMEKRSCDNKYYIPNLTTALKRAVEQKDIEAIITYAGELERFKVICGFTPAIEQFEESLKHYGREMGLLDHPAIERALNTIPQKTCCECCESEQPSHREGFIAMLESAHPTTEKQDDEVVRDTLEESHTNSEFQRMLDASGKNSEPHTIVRQIQSWDFEYKLPEICNDECFAKRFCGSYPRNLGNVCVKKWEQYKNKQGE
jgi:hypothetical protein